MSKKLLKNNRAFSLYVILSFLGVWCVFSQTITFAADGLQRNDNDSFLLWSWGWTIVGGLVASFITGALRDKVDEFVIGFAGHAAILNGCAQNIFALKGKTIKEGAVRPVENELSCIFPEPGVDEAEEYRLKNAILSASGKRARINGVLEGWKNNEPIWHAQIVGRGRYVNAGEHVLQGSFYLQCECKSIIPITKNSKQKIGEMWQATYVFRSTDATHFEGHWLLRDAYKSERAGFGTLDLTLEEKLPFLKRLSKLVSKNKL